MFPMFSFCVFAQMERKYSFCNLEFNVTHKHTDMFNKSNIVSIILEESCTDRLISCILFG